MTSRFLLYCAKRGDDEERHGGGRYGNGYRKGDGGKQWAESDRRGVAALAGAGARVRLFQPIPKLSKCILDTRLSAQRFPAVSPKRSACCRDVVCDYDGRNR